MKKHLKLSMVVFGMALAVNISVFADDMHGSHEHTKQVGANKSEQTDFGAPGDAKQVSRTIIVNMSDMMKFMSGDLQIKKGETIKFITNNTDKHMQHEMMINTMEALKEHAKYMRKFPNMEHVESNIVSVPPGKTDEIVWNFNKSGVFYYACLIPGHMEAGMINKITVN